ncbi:hypothetical protein PNOK_0302000 [Pyrrhoderma noxium]|uniref:Uncharacterized protein n=1 Tax=Pyrrhoderma noxium TaxID=2282107 RepID=A0A286ULC5_9AGAM|nr:hypothetical protein PNOK_0302000 [Pyrrhoderma noxium]
MVVEPQRRVKGTDKQKKKVDVESQHKESTRVERDSVTTLVVEASENSKNVFAKRPLETMVEKKNGDSAGTSESSKVSGRARAQSDPTSERRGYRAVKNAARDGLSKIIRPEIPLMEDILKGKKIPTPHIPRALQPSRKRGSSV